MFATKVRIHREGDLYVPVINMHHDHCKRHKGCCSWRHEKCYKLASTDFATAKKSAQKLARCFGVPLS